MKSVLDYLPSKALTVILVVSGLVSVLTYDYIIEVNRSLPEYMMFDLVFAKSIDKAQQVVAAWSSSPQAMGKANMVIGMNYLLSLTYPIFFLLACHILSAQNKNYPLVKQAGIIIGWIMPIAGLVDAYENVPLTMLVNGSDNTLLPTLTYLSGTIKYSLILMASLYCIISLLISMYRKIRWRRHPEPQTPFSHKPDKYKD